MTLPDAPATPWDGTTLLAGTYRGECERVDIDGRFGRLARVRSQKRWLWCGAMNSAVAVGIAFVRTGYGANVFCWVFDRSSGAFLRDISRITTRSSVHVATATPNFGEAASFRSLRDRCRLVRDGTRWSLVARIGDINLDIDFTESTPPATAICPTSEPGRLNVTRKQAAATTVGTVTVGDMSHDLSGIGMLDHSHGMLPRETVWRWAIGAGTRGEERIAFNLVSDFNDQLENVIWVDGVPTAAGRVTFIVPERPLDVWRVEGERVDLMLQPEGIRDQTVNLGVLASSYTQPLGVWVGEIDGEPVRCDGVAELHRSVW